MKNKLAYLGFLGFFSLLFPIIQEAYAMFFFFFFFMYRKIEPDELFIAHVHRASWNGLFIGLIVFVPSFIAISALENIALIKLLISIVFLTIISVFMISLEIYERRERKSLEA